MNEPKHESCESRLPKSRIWDAQLQDYRLDTDFEKEFEEEGSIVCPACDTTIYKEDRFHKIVYCDNCGYDF